MKKTKLRSIAAKTAVTVTAFAAISIPSSTANAVNYHRCDSLSPAEFTKLTGLPTEPTPTVYSNGITCMWYTPKGQLSIITMIHGGFWDSSKEEPPTPKNTGCRSKTFMPSDRSWIITTDNCEWNKEIVANIHKYFH